MFLACQVRRNTSTFRKLREYAASWQAFSPSTPREQQTLKTLAHQKWPNCPKTYADDGGIVVSGDFGGLMTF